MYQVLRVIQVMSVAFSELFWRSHADEHQNCDYSFRFPADFL